MTKSSKLGNKKNNLPVSVLQVKLSKALSRDSADSHRVCSHQALNLALRCSLRKILLGNVEFLINSLYAYVKW